MAALALLFLIPCIALYLVANVVVVRLLFALARRLGRRVVPAATTRPLEEGHDGHGE